MLSLENKMINEQDDSGNSVTNFDSHTEIVLVEMIKINLAEKCSSGMATELRKERNM